jgi:hypothetical protein
VRLDRLQPLDAVFGHDDVVAGHLQRDFQELPLVLVILDQQDVELAQHKFRDRRHAPCPSAKQFLRGRPATC